MISHMYISFSIYKHYAKHVQLFCELLRFI
nr:MAG TPA: hypothetical protein [Caudoviricetes sp.]